MLRESEADKEFRKKLQNVPKPINNTDPDPILEEYIDKLNSGEAIKETKKEKEKEEEDYELFCPTCRKRNMLKRNNAGTYSCGFCGLTSMTPLRMKKNKK